MKTLLAFVIASFPFIAYAQPDTEVFVASIAWSDGQLQLSQVRNISANPGYDNQPSWFDANTLLYARNVNGATDIAKVDLTDPDRVAFPYQATEGGEYSPQRLPGNTKDALAVRLDPDGYQGLYRYNADKAESIELIPGLRMAYYALPTADIAIGSLLSDNRLDLVKVHLRESRIDTLLEDAGRSIHLRPGKNAVSYSASSEDTDGLDLFQLDLDSGESFYIKDLPLGVQDYAWLDGDKVIIGSGPRLFLYDLFEGGKWKEVANLQDYGIKDITRMSVSPDGNRIAFVTKIEASPESIVQAQLDAYNARDIDAFMATYSENITLFNYPDQPMGNGKAEMRASYKAFFDSAPDLHCEILNRIVMGNKVIDQERVTANGREFEAVAVYEVINGKIAKVTFIR